MKSNMDYQHLFLLLSTIVERGNNFYNDSELKCNEYRRLAFYLTTAFDNPTSEFHFERFKELATKLDMFLFNEYCEAMKDYTVNHSFNYYDGYNIATNATTKIINGNLVTRYEIVVRGDIMYPNLTKEGFDSLLNELLN